MRERKLGRGVALVGAGMSRFGAFLTVSSRDLLVEAFLAMRDSVDRGFDPRDIEAVFVGNFSSDQFENQGHTAPIYANWLGLTPRPAARIENACASGGSALHQGVQAIASGLYDIVLVGGVEKMTSQPLERVTDALATAADVLYETPAGFTFPGFYAAMASAYLDRYPASLEMLMEIAIKNHANGALNEKAQFQASIPQLMERAIKKARERNMPPPTWQDAYEFLSDPRANPMIAYPLRLFDCSPVSDGGAALLLVAQDIAGSFSHTPVHITGSAMASDGALHNRSDLTWMNATRAAAGKAYAMSGTRADDIRLAEVHDCFTIAEVIATEDLGFFAPGSGAHAAQDGMTARDGRYPVNTSGGLKAKGHPVGASGVAQVVEVWKQMRGEAGSRQVDRDINLALTHNVGGTGQTCAVHIFERG